MHAPDGMVLADGKIAQSDGRRRGQGFPACPPHSQARIIFHGHVPSGGLVAGTERLRVRIDLDWPKQRIPLELVTTGPGETDIAQLPSGLAHGTVALSSVAPGLAYLHGQFTVVRPSGQGRVHVPQSCFQFVFHRLHTPARVMWDPTATAVRFGYQNVIVLGPNSCPTRFFSVDEQIDEISLLVETSCIESIVERLGCPIAERLESAIAGTGAVPFLSSGITTSEMRHSLAALTNCNLSPDFKRLYQEARVHEILVLCLAQFAAPSCTDRDVFLLQRDLELLERAHDILLNRLADPPGIAELAALIGLNQTKLKAGFKEVYGVTVFGFVRLKRMQHALYLLSAGEYNVGEVAAALGYKSSGSFTRAFQAEFGCGPGSIRGQGLNARGPTSGSPSLS